MIITEAEMHRRLNSSKNLINSLPPARPSAVRIEHQPMHKNTPTAPAELKAVAATLVALGEKSVDVQSALGLSAKQVYSAKNSEAVKNTVDRVRELALDKMLIAMDLMSEEKFANANLKDLSSVAANLSRVVEKTSPRENAGTHVQFIIHSPQAKNLSQYQVVDV
jgi:Holliday junction resolvasome RuvABC endonuclease subunit